MSMRARATSAPRSCCWPSSIKTVMSAVTSKQRCIYAGMNDGERALQALESAVHDSSNSGRFTDIAYLGVDPAFDSLRDNKSFQALLTKAAVH